MYQAVLSQNIALGRLKECWDVAFALNNPEVSNHRKHAATPHTACEFQ
jgi:hypothetical protein